MFNTIVSEAGAPSAFLPAGTAYTYYRPGVAAARCVITAVIVLMETKSQMLTPIVVAVSATITDD